MGERAGEPRVWRGTVGASYLAKVSFAFVTCRSLKGSLAI